MKSNLKVAITQDYIRYGGRFMVIATMIDALNKLNITPDVLSFVSDIDSKGVEKKYHNKLKFTAIKVPFNWFKKMTEFRKIWFNLIIMSKYYKKYDIIINSNNSAIFLQSQSVINYIHFPRFDRILKNEFFNTHKNIKLKTSFLVRVDYLLSRGLYNLFSLDKDQANIANSIFTKKRLSAVHAIPESKIDVLYPPVVTDEAQPYQASEKKGFIISIGRFSQTKNQLLQLKIAKKIPQLQFKLIGFSKEGNDYLKTCYQFIEEQQLDNVELLVNISYDELQRELKQATFFLHTTFEEPFGITPVQAIANNCIPIVPNSGGPIEIVTLSNLRYNTKEEAIQIILEMHNKEDHSLLLQELKNNLKRFSKDEFISKFNKILQGENFKK